MLSIKARPLPLRNKRASVVCKTSPREVALCGLAGGLTGLILIQLFQPFHKDSMFIAAKQDDKIFNIAKKNIRWFTEDNGCLYVCTNDEGCLMNTKFRDKWIICKDELPKSYAKLNKL